MSFDDFKIFISGAIKNGKNLNELHSLNIDLINFASNYEELIDLLLYYHYGEEAYEWINWFLYERVSFNGELLKVYDKDGNEICKSIEELYTIVEECRDKDVKEKPKSKSYSNDELNEIFKDFF